MYDLSDMRAEGYMYGRKDKVLTGIFGSGIQAGVLYLSNEIAVRVL